MRIGWLLVTGALVAAPAAHAQTIVGRVVEAETANPIDGVVIEATGRGGATVATTRTDSVGAFLLRLNRAGRFTLTLTHPSFSSTGAMEVNVNPDESLVIELRMARTSIPLEPLLVISERDPRLTAFYQRMQRAGSGQFLTRADMENRPAARTTDLLREMHGVEIVTTGGGLARPRVNLITLRGGRGRCMPTIYIDGLVVDQYPESGIDDFLKPDMLAGAEVYTSGVTAPSPISARNACGVVAFWTRPVEVDQPWSWQRLLAGAAALSALGLLVLLSR